MDKNQKVIAGLAGALGLALLAVAFLMGRASAPPTPVATTTSTALAPVPEPVATGAVLDPSVSTPSSAGPTTPAEPASVPTGREATPAASFVPTEPEPASLLPPVTTPSRTAPAAANDRQAVAAYFAQMDQAGDLGAGDPQAFANSMMQSVSSGDFTSFDELVSKARAQRDRLQGMSPPPACVAHHRLALALANSSVTMLQRMRTALGSNDTTALMSIATEARALEAQANQLKTMGDAIRKQTGA